MPAAPKTMALGGTCGNRKHHKKKCENACMHRKNRTDKMMQGKRG